MSTDTVQHDTSKWFALDALDIPAGALDEMRSVITELRAMVPALQQLLQRAKAAEQHAIGNTDTEDMPDEVFGSLCEVTGHCEFAAILNVIAWETEQFTASTIRASDREAIREAYGIWSPPAPEPVVPASGGRRLLCLEGP
jgi:hypothetical protein